MWQGSKKDVPGRGESVGAGPTLPGRSDRQNNTFLPLGRPALVTIYARQHPIPDETPDYCAGDPGSSPIRWPSSLAR